MHLMDWPFLDALQAGALAALFLSFGADALDRRDRMLGFLALTCLLVGLRHGVLAVATSTTLNPDHVDRVQSLLVSLAFIALCTTLVDLFPHHIPRRFPGWMALGLVPNFLRNLFIPHPSPVDAWFHGAANLAYLVGCGLIIHWSLRARQDGNPMGRRLFLGLLVLALPVVVEISAFTFFNLRLRLSGLCLVLLTLFIGTSWHRLVVHGLEARIRRAEAESGAWRSLVPGLVFRTDEPSPLLDGLFGEGWAGRVGVAPEAPHLGTDGLWYRVRSRPLPPSERLGWFERNHDGPPGQQGFLSGWTVGLGMDDPAELARVQSLLRSWGAEVQVWGTIPPWEGPYPSVLIWAREPSILSVWREHDLRHRRSRWIQVGGPATEGPHARLEPGAPEDGLRRILEGLLSRR